MEKAYANNRVRKAFEDYAQMQRKLPLEWVRTIKKHIDRLEAADNFGIFLSLGLGHPHPLEGYDGLRYSIHVTGNVRLVIDLKPGQGAIAACAKFEIQGVCDYHGDKENWYIS